MEAIKLVGVNLWLKPDGWKAKDKKTGEYYDIVDSEAQRLKEDSNGLIATARIENGVVTTLTGII